MPGSSKKKEEESPLVKSLCLLDPLLQFLTKKSGKTSVPLSLLSATLPGGCSKHPCLLDHIPELDKLGILRLHWGKHAVERPQRISWEDALEIGFPSPPLVNYDDEDPNRQTPKQSGSLCGSTKTAAKRRLAALKRILKSTAQNNSDNPGEASATASKDDSDEIIGDENDKPSNSSNLKKDWDLDSHEDAADDFEEELCHEAKTARDALEKMFRFKQRPKKGEKTTEISQKNAIPEYILPKQASYSASHPAQTPTYDDLTAEAKSKIPGVILSAFGLGGCSSDGQKKLNQRKLYSHQAKAISSAVMECHTLVCTSTGSGKSLCFLIPALAAAYRASIAGASKNEDDSSRGISLIMFPTKALAQDQLTKLKALLSQNEELEKHIFPAALDGDCPHELRSHIAKNANVILTNPDTLHAAILPQWNKLYKRVLAGLQYVVIDEAHVYEGMFGTHVALILSRLQRLCVVTRCDKGMDDKTPTFLSSSATLEYPEYHMRLLCPIPKSSKVNVLTPKDDGSPRSAKHFFVWNPPLLTMAGESTGSVFYPKPPSKKQQQQQLKAQNDNPGTTPNKRQRKPQVATPTSEQACEIPDSENIQSNLQRNHTHTNTATQPNGFRRRHAADETAMLLARAITKNIRCIAFCKTRSVVEWVYERTIAALRRDDSTKHLVDKVSPYRGGYKLSDRREIEKKLFEKELLGVVATSALELGVDIGGIELTLHTGYPTSVSSLLQQAGRAGRGGAAVEKPSLSVVVCFGSPSEQYLWKKPACLLSRGISSPRSFPINAGVVQGHLLCASKEFPLTGKDPVSVLRTSDPNKSIDNNLPDQELFGSQEAYDEALETLRSNGSVVQFRAPVATGGHLTVYKAHAFMDKPWMRVSVRSVEPVSFSIVDISHPSQGGQMNKIHDEKAVLDNLPYSRVFYHAFPGAIILHRGTHYKVLSMTRPPPYDPCSTYRGNSNLAAFAKPTKEKYMTRPLSTNTITIVKQIERADANHPVAEKMTQQKGKEQQKESPTSVTDPYSSPPDQAEGSFAGCGVVTSKRTVHGYKKLSLITRSEMSRHELSLPAMEYDTFGLWIDAEAETLGAFLGNDYGSGVHALSHALLAVAPLFIPCVRGDLECDHSSYSPTRVCLFDERAGGSGTCAELWKSLFIPDGLLEAAVDLLKNCPSCCQEDNDLGCPACLQSGECVKFNQFLSRSAGLTIGNRMVQRLKKTERYQRHVKTKEVSPEGEDKDDNGGTPRKKARTQAMRNAKDIQSARERLFVVGRPSWPTDEDNMPSGRQEHAA